MSDSPVVMELLAMTGYGHMIIDHEHSPTDSSSGQVLLQAMDSAAGIMHHRTEPIIRVADQDATYMKKILDSLKLPGGVLVPMVETAQAAETIVAATRYPRQTHGDLNGMRGCAVPFVRASGYGIQMSTQEYMRQCQEDLLVMVQVETPKGVEAIPEIAAVPGIDGIFLGPFDISCSIGKVGQFEDAEVQELMQKAEQAVRSTDCFLAGFRSSGRDLNTMFWDDGYSLICGSVDLGLLRNAAQRDATDANQIMCGEPDRPK